MSRALNKNKNFDVTIAFFGGWITGLLGIYLIQDGVSLAYDPIPESIEVETPSNSLPEESLTETIVFQSQTLEQLNLHSHFIKNNINNNISFYIPQHTNQLNIIDIPDFEPVSRTISHKTLELIREFEGFRSQAYFDTDGTPVIGYGLSKVAGKKVQMGDRLSVEEAESALAAEVHTIQEQIQSIVEVELNSHQLGALTSFAFNTGFYGLKNSTLLRKLNAGDHYGAANEFLRWNKASVGGALVPLAGLTRRRQAEKELFLTPPSP